MTRMFSFRCGCALAFFAGVLVVPGLAGQAAAQDVAPAGVSSAVTQAPVVAAAAVPATLTAVVESGELDPNKIPSVLFTYWEHTAIADAKSSIGAVRPPTEEELMRDLKTKQVDKVKPPPEERDIRLGGIVYVTNDDWTVWLNGKRVTPDAIPSEVLDLKVRKEYIEMKWFDDYTNQIFPIRLRAHQRFNIDSKIFLPG
ncbi:MAG: hypothetical protein WBK77_00505 [Alphaproteobacteria bacterium]